MKHLIFPISAAALMLGSAACSKHAPVAANTPPPAAPVASTPTPARTPAPKPTPTPSTTARNTAPTQTRGDRPTAEERFRLDQSLARLEDALFDFDKATIRSDASVALKDDVNVIKEILSHYPSQKLLIEGHADERGSEEYNLALGDRRAKAVEEFLTSMGIPSAQLTLISYGKERPVCTEETEQCWQRNRRAHVTAAP